MDDLLRSRLAALGGTVRTSDLAALGYDRHGVDRLVRKGLLRRVRQGAYVDAARFDAADEAARHRLQARAVVRTLPGHAASHVSALVCWELPVLRSDLDGRVHVSGIGHGASRSANGIRVHTQVSAADVTKRDGIPVVAAELAVLQTCETIGARAGLIAAEAGLRAGSVSRDELARREAGGGWGMAGAVIVALADDRSESAGESWCRLVFAGLGIGQPEQQVDIYDERGGFVGRVDFLFRKLGIVVEFDGLAKYEGAGGREALVAEKRREDALRRLGYRVVRLTWADLADPARVLRLLGI